MGVQVVWDNTDKTVVRFIYEGSWTWQEYHQTIQTANAMMDTVAHPVVSIVDMRATKYIPPNAMRHIRQVINESRNHNNSNIAVYLGADDFTQALVNATQRIYLDVRAFSQFFYAESLEAARELAHDLRRKIVVDPFSDTQPIY